MSRQLLQPCVIALFACHVALAQDPLGESKKESSEQVQQLRDLAAKRNGKHVKKPADKLPRFAPQPLAPPIISVPDGGPPQYSAKDPRLEHKDAVSGTTAASCIELDILIACVVFDEKGELRLKKEGGESEVTGVGTIASILAAKLNEQRDELPSGATPGAAGANFLLQRLASEEKLESLEQFRLRLTADGTVSRLQDANRMPRIVGSTVSQRGTSNTIEMENVGVTIIGSAQITKTGRIAVTIDLERSAFGPPEEGIIVSVQKDTAIRTPRLDIMMLKTQVALTDGASTVLKSAVRSWGDEVTESLVIVTATVVK